MGLAQIFPELLPQGRLFHSVNPYYLSSWIIQIIREVLLSEKIFQNIDKYRISKLSSRITVSNYLHFRNTG